MRSGSTVLLSYFLPTGIGSGGLSRWFFPTAKEQLQEFVLSTVGTHKLKFRF